MGIAEIIQWWLLHARMMMGQEQRNVPPNCPISSTAGRPLLSGVPPLPPVELATDHIRAFLVEAEHLPASRPAKPVLRRKQARLRWRSRQEICRRVLQQRGSVSLSQ